MLGSSLAPRNSDLMVPSRPGRTTTNAAVPKTSTTRTLARIRHGSAGMIAMMAMAAARKPVRERVKGIAVAARQPQTAASCRRKRVSPNLV